MDREEFCKKITNKAEKIEIKLNKKQQDDFFEYMNLLLEWNQKINLTAITNPEEVVTKHFIDCLTILKYINDADSVVDVGTGAGFPGLPIKIVRDRTKVTLVDSLNKRINFLNNVIEKLELENVEAIHGRAEEFGRNKNYREKYDVSVSRAVARLNILVEYLLPTVKVGGKCICMKGPDLQEEVEEAKPAIELLGGKISNIEEFTLPGTDNKRTIIIIDKIKNTPARFPRKAGTPSKDPIK